MMLHNICITQYRRLQYHQQADLNRNRHQNFLLYLIFHISLYYLPNYCYTCCYLNPFLSSLHGHLLLKLASVENSIPSATLIFRLVRFRLKFGFKLDFWDALTINLLSLSLFARPLFSAKSIKKIFNNLCLSFKRTSTNPAFSSRFLT